MWKRVSIIAIRQCSGSSSPVLRIGNLKVNVKVPKRPELVPAGFASKNAPPEIVRHLKWLLQKDMLRQDVFLLGPPGLLRPHIVMQYLELINREYEYLSITRDTTEADIKQRREIRSNCAIYTDQCAVRAALEGRVLIIDGVEQAERNVLPIINNLLENREMQLDDGRFLMKYDTYDNLLEQYSKNELARMGYERVSEDFHIVALGLPVPRFSGHSLDPPLRSRFQCCHIPTLSFEMLSKMFKSAAVSVNPQDSANLLAMAYALSSNEDWVLPLPPMDNLLKIANIWENCSNLSSNDMFQMLYPKEAIVKNHEKNIVAELQKKFDIDDEESSGHIADIGFNHQNAVVYAECGGRKFEFAAPRGFANVLREHSFASGPDMEAFMLKLACTHAQSDFFLLGAKGSGKTSVVEEFARRFGYVTETMVMYQDLHSRDFMQQRRMLSNGDTIWEDSQLVKAARNGYLCVLDGVDRIHASALQALAPLIHFRHLNLPDGSKLVSQNEFDLIRQKLNLTKEELQQKNVFPISPSFRMVLVGDSENTENSWLNEAALSLAPFHNLSAVPHQDSVRIIQNAASGVSPTTAKVLVKLVNSLVESKEAEMVEIAKVLSLRKLIHIAQRDVLFPGELRTVIEDAALAKFLPLTARAAFTRILNLCHINDDPKLQKASSDDFDAIRRTLRPGDEALIPSTLFYDNEQHTKILQNLARDFRLGNHLLLIGNQGVGKNKLADKFLSSISCPRQYMQLHRDTTVETLTLQTTIEDGRLKHEDSALVKAVKNGYVLVVDEADKAPLHVIAILKSLLDSGTLVLGDGRRIQPCNFEQNEHTIPLHPDFRMIMLANRPGFPFLGNDMFSVLGDMFAVHAVDNPSRSSELQMLEMYGPSVPKDHLNKLLDAFSELREKADSGLMQYPYSTRELVNIVKHLNKFPEDSLATVVKNVFDFDHYSSDVISTIESIFQKHGIPLGVKNTKDLVFLSPQHQIAFPENLGSWGFRENSVPRILETQAAQYPKAWQMIDGIEKQPLEKQHMRSSFFSEQICHWQLPIPDTNLCSDALLVDDLLCVAAVNPPALNVIRNFTVDNSFEQWPLMDYIKRRNRDKFEPIIRLARLGDFILLHEEEQNSLLLIDPIQKRVAFLFKPQNMLSGVLGSMFAEQTKSRLVPGHKPLVYTINGTSATILSLAKMMRFDFPEPVSKIIEASDDRWLVTYASGKSVMLCLENDLLLRELKHRLSFDAAIEAIVPVPNSNDSLMKVDGFHFVQNDMFPRALLDSEVLGSRKKTLLETDVIDHRRPFYVTQANINCDKSRSTVALDGHVLISNLAKWETPTIALAKDLNPNFLSGFLEVVDIKKSLVQYVPVGTSRYHTYHQAWMHKISKTPFFVIPWTDKKLLTVDMSGGVRSFELTPSIIGESYKEWQKMLGEQDDDFRIEYAKSMEDFDLNKLMDPTAGKFDPDNMPHHGGNQWMGGTGGYSTAGLGGVGGPFRMDAGHDVYQLPDSAKLQVPPHILQKAREVAKAEYAKKLKEIKMSEYDDDAYQKLWTRVENQSNQLRSVIEQLEAKKKERLWSRHQTSGDFDDGKLIEGMTGEKNIYRRRVEKEPEPGSPQEKPKHLRLHFDVSGSMYRFNGYDKRLQKSLEAALMIMTALDGKDAKVKYDIYGHSGDGCNVPFVHDKYPVNNKDRLDVLRQMLLHAQFCPSGDSTVEALVYSIKELAKENDVDERIVILVSDANMDRYGIRPEYISNALKRDATVNAFVIFVGSLGEEATRLQKSLPAGKAFVCKETSELPQIMKTIFASTIFSS